MRLLNVLSVFAIGAAMVGCGDDTTTNQDLTTAPADMAVNPHAGQVAVTFSVDDTANKVFAAGDLQWKGSMKFDDKTGVITKDSSWGGPFATLYDDGPTDKGGHEPAGATAGDHIWGVTVWVVPPSTGEDTYEYGLIDSVYEKNFGNGWVWKGSNGTFAIKAGATGSVKATGMTFAKFGTTDFQLVIDKTKADQTTAWDFSKVGVKGSGWAWAIVPLTAAGNTYTFTLSENVGAGKMFPHSGLLSSGDKPEFVYQLGAGSGKEYKDAGGTALATGVTAQIKPSGGSWTAATIKVNSMNKNTYVDVP